MGLLWNCFLQVVEIFLRKSTPVFSGSGCSVFVIYVTITALLKARGPSYYKVNTLRITKWNREEILGPGYLLTSMSYNNKFSLILNPLSNFLLFFKVPYFQLQVLSINSKFECKCSRCPLLNSDNYRIQLLFKWNSNNIVQNIKAALEEMWWYKVFLGFTNYDKDLETWERMQCGMKNGNSMLKLVFCRYYPLSLTVLKQD